jgi:hypothetical protein
MFTKARLLGLLASIVITATASAQTPGKPSGAWIVDAKATETFVLGAPSSANGVAPADIANMFALAGAYVGLTMVELDGDAANFATYGNLNKGPQYRLLSQSGAETKYIAIQARDSTEDTLTVTILSDTNIRIAHRRNQLLPYVLWKRVELEPRQRTPNVVNAHTDAWLASIQNIVNTLKAQPGSQQDAAR